MTKYITNVPVAAVHNRPTALTEQLEKFSRIFKSALVLETREKQIASSAKIYPRLSYIPSETADGSYDISLRLSFIAAYTVAKDAPAIADAVTAALSAAADEAGVTLDSISAIREAVRAQLEDDRICALYYNPDHKDKSNKPDSVAYITENAENPIITSNDTEKNIKFKSTDDNETAIGEGSGPYLNSNDEWYILTKEAPKKAPETPTELSKAFIERFTQKQHKKLFGLLALVTESLNLYHAFPGIVSIELHEDFIFDSNIKNLPSLPKDAQLDIYAAAQMISIAAKRYISYYSLQKALSISDLHKLLTASVGNMLLIYCYDDANYRKFLSDDKTLDLLREFCGLVQYVIVYYDNYSFGDLLAGLDIIEDEVTKIDMSSLDIKKYDNEAYLRKMLLDECNDISIINEYINQFDDSEATKDYIIKNFREFKRKKLDDAIQTKLRLLPKTSDDEPLSRRRFLESALAVSRQDKSKNEFSYEINWDAELDNIVGLDIVKQQLKNLKDVFYSRFIRGKTNNSAKRVFTFEGNPGCGKTMVAKYFAYSLKQAGLLSAAEPFHDIKISELVGTHLGEAADQTDRIFKECSGSVIFIDEAYGLLDEGQYGRSAINQIVKNISSMTPDTILILAGYPSDIGRLLKENRGLESRITQRIKFSDYSCDELLDILNINLKSRCGLYLDKTKENPEDKFTVIEARIRKFLLKISACGEKDTGRSLGNARFIDNLIGKLEIYHAESLPQNLDRTDPAALRELDVLTYDTAQRALNDLEAEFEKTGSVIGSTRPTYYTSTKESDTFDRIIGNTNAKKQLKQQLEIFNNPERYSKVTEGTRGILLTGDPGCGKTLLARAMAHEIEGAAFMCANGTDFIKKYSGEGADKIQALFDEIETYEKCVLFIDEIDAIGKSRSAGEDRAVLENQALMKLLTCLDGFSRRENFLVIAATNTPDALDPALLRRLGTKIAVELPNPEERYTMLKLFLDDLGSGDSISEIQLRELAEFETTGFSGDRIHKCAKAAYIAAGGNENKITFRQLEEAIQNSITGFDGNTRMSEEEKERVAYHEIGHAFIAHRLGSPILKVSIIPNDNGSLGYTVSPPNASHTLTKADIENRICILLGGRAAEELFKKNASAGCREDLKRASELAADMAANCGMGAKLRVRDLDSPDVLDEADRILEDCYTRTRELLAANEDSVRELAAALIKNETLSREAFSDILK